MNEYGENVKCKTFIIANSNSQINQVSVPSFATISEQSLTWYNFLTYNLSSKHFVATLEHIF